MPVQRSFCPPSNAISTRSRALASVQGPSASGDARSRRGGCCAKERKCARATVGRSGGISVPWWPCPSGSTVPDLTTVVPRSIDDPVFRPGLCDSSPGEAVARLAQPRRTNLVRSASEAGPADSLRATVACQCRVFTSSTLTAAASCSFARSASTPETGRPRARQRRTASRSHSAVEVGRRRSPATDSLLGHDTDRSVRWISSPCPLVDTDGRSGRTPVTVLSRRPSNRPR
jgi:hypothetical protein